METALKPVESKGPSLKANEALIVGRINHVGSFSSGGNRIHEARVAIPAADQFSMPGAVLIQSKNKLGNVGDDVRVHVTVGGFPDKWTDRESGEVRQTARIVLREVE